ncbi:MAG: haloacid dehalogenase-like hydrolase [Anaerolineales bacterium]
MTLPPTPMDRWTSFDLIFFDCDSTLSTLEGIDELARLKGKELRVGVLTQKAMDGDLDLAEVYGKRLRALNPTRTQLETIKDRYWETTVPDAPEIIAALHWLQKHVYIISGGLLDAVQGFGARLGVAPAHIRAVELAYDELSGEWWRYHDQRARGEQRYLDYDEGPLTVTAGKPDIVRQLAGDTWGRRLFIGDGSSDLATQDNGVDLFVGFGGVVARKKVEQEAAVFIYSESLAPLLPLITGPEAATALRASEHAALFERGLALARDTDAVRFNRPGLAQAFRAAFEGL